MDESDRDSVTRSPPVGTCRSGRRRRRVSGSSDVSWDSGPAVEMRTTRSKRKPLRPFSQSASSSKRSRHIVKDSRLFCLFCDGRKWRTQHQFRQHMVGHRDIDIYLCVNCTYGFLTQLEFSAHDCTSKTSGAASRAHRRPDCRWNPIFHFALCTCCGHRVVFNHDMSKRLPFLDPKFLRERYRKVTVYVDAADPKCSRVDHIPMALRLRYLSGRRSLPTKCHVCAGRFLSATELYTHLLSAHPGDYACLSCNMVFQDAFESHTHRIHKHQDSNDDLGSVQDFLSFLGLPIPLEDSNQTKIANSVNSAAVVYCDLCGQDINAGEFNDHDCATCYTRRLLYSNEIIKCPSVNNFTQAKDLCVEVCKEDCFCIPQGLLHHLTATLELELDSAKMEKARLCSCVPQYKCQMCQEYFTDFGSFHAHYLNCIQLYPPSDNMPAPSPPASDEEGFYADGEPFGLTRKISAENTAIDEGVLPSHSASQQQACGTIAASAIPTVSGRETVQLISSSGLTEQAPVVDITDDEPVEARTSRITQHVYRGTPLPGMAAGTYTFNQFPEAAIPSCIPSTFAGTFTPTDSAGPVYFVYGAAAQAVLQGGGVKLATIPVPNGVPHPAVTSVVPVSGLKVTHSAVQPAVGVRQPVVEQPAPFTCPVCKVGATGTDLLKAHLRMSHLHVCSKCAHCFVTVLRLDAHTHDGTCPANITPLSKFSCDLCATQVNSPYDFYKHLVEQHPGRVNFNEKTGQVFPLCVVLMPEIPPAVSSGSAAASDLDDIEVIIPQKKETIQPAPLVDLDHQVEATTCSVSGPESVDVQNTIMMERLDEAIAANASDDSELESDAILGMWTFRDSVVDSSSSDLPTAGYTMKDSSTPQNSENSLLEDGSVTADDSSVRRSKRVRKPTALDRDFVPGDDDDDDDYGDDKGEQVRDEMAGEQTPEDPRSTCEDDDKRSMDRLSDRWIDDLECKEQLFGKHVLTKAEEEHEVVDIMAGSAQKGYFCRLCSAPLQSRSHGQAHYNAEHRTASKRCPVCHEQLEYIHVAKRHVRDQHFGDTTRCPLCEMKFSRVEDTVEHALYACTKTTGHLCFTCNLLHDNEDELIRHKLAVHSVAFFMCEHCDQTFIWERKYRQHLRMHETKESSATHTLCCVVCEAALPDRQHLLTHYLTHSKENYSYCFVCQTNFTTVKKFKEHLKTHTNAIVAEPHVIVVSRRSTRYAVKLLPKTLADEEIERRKREKSHVLATELFVPVFRPADGSSADPEGTFALSHNGGAAESSSASSREPPSPNATTEDRRSAESSTAESEGEHHGVVSEETRADQECMIRYAQDLHEASAQNTSDTATASSTVDDDADELEIVEINDDDDDASPHGRFPVVLRKATHTCNICNKSFLTMLALREHIDSHAQDAGATSDRVLPTPPDLAIYVCRVCCLSYSSVDMYRQHASKHNAFVSCQDCSAVCFTRDQVKNHREAHAQQLFFGCGLCLRAMKSELLLHTHLSVFHHVLLVWICKQCSYGHQHMGQVLKHIQSMHTSIVLQNAPRFGGNVEKAAMLELAVCAHKKLHFQPDPSTEALAAACQLPVGDCPHRTFMAYNETLIACEKCGTLVPSTKFLLENESARRMGQIKLSLADDEAELSRATQAVRASAAPMMSQMALGAPTVARMLQPTALQPPVVVAPVRYPTATISPHAQQTLAHRQLSAQAVTMRQPIPQQKVAYGSSTRPPTVVTGPTVRPPVATRPQLSAASAQQRPTGGQSLDCKTCKTRLPTFASYKVHMLKHLDEHKYFCLECGTSFTSHNELLEHLKHTHASKIVYDIGCPVCNRKFATKAEFCSHKHPNNFTMVCTACFLPFFTQIAYDKHVRSHEFVCLHCPSFKAQSLIALDVHEMSHCYDPWMMCRECGLCYRNFQQIQEHFGNTHIISGGPASKFTCKICSTSFLNGPTLNTHMQRVHQVTAVKLKPKVELKASELKTLLAAEQPSLRMPTAAPTPVITTSTATRYASPVDGSLQTVWVCQFCKLVSSSVDQMKRHAREHDYPGFWTLRCPDADRARHSMYEPTFCTLCPEQSELIYMFEHLSAKHNFKGYFPCTLCPEEFVSRYDRNYHLQFNHDKRTVVDEIMDKMQEHTYSHDCLFCAMGFVGYAELYKHIMTAHTGPGNILTFDAATDAAGTTTCEVKLCLMCGLAFHDDAVLQRHVVNHNQQGMMYMEKLSHFGLLVCGLGAQRLNVVCKYCGLELGVGAFAYEHFFTHHVALPEIVEGLHKPFTTSASGEVRMHEAACRVCRFVNRSHRVADCNEASTSGVGSTACLVCRRAFPNRHSLAAHMATHKSTKVLPQQ